MQAKHLLVLGTMGLAASALAGGCSSDPDETGTGGGGGTGLTTTTTTILTGTTTTTDTNSSTTSTTSTGDGNDSFDTAEAIEIDATDWTLGEMDPADSDADYYTFEGTAGQAIYVLTDCKPNDDPYNPDYPDLVATLYNSAQVQIAQNDDPFPRSTQDPQLLTILPETGTYYVKIEEFCASELGAGQPGCTDYFPQLTETAYGVLAVTLDGADEGNVAEEGTEPNDDTANAVAMEYAVTDTAGSYYLTLGYGYFDSGTDVDFYEINLPDDLALDGADPVISVATYPAGADGNGSTAEVGLVTLWAADGTTKIAEVNASYGGDISPPGTLADTYFLSVARQGTTAGAHDFYFLNHSGTAYLNEAETEPNDAYGTANTLTGQVDGETTSYFCQGTLDPAGADTLDHFAFTAQAGQVASVACGARRSGSGLRGFGFKLINAANGQDIANSELGPEMETDDLFLEEAALGGATNVVLQVTATSQDAAVTSDFYRCGVHLTIPQ